MNFTKDPETMPTVNISGNEGIRSGMSRLSEALKTLEIKECAAPDEDESYCKEHSSNSHELIMEFSNLKIVPSEILKLKHLRFLNLAHNHLRSLPHELGNLRNLVCLDLSFNKLDSLPKSLSDVTNLKHLNISHNDFTDVPHSLYEGLRYLNSLNLSYNKIKNFSDSPMCVNNVVDINLSHNELSTIHEWFFFDSRLQHLDVSYNVLSSMIKDYPFCQNDIQRMNVHIKELNLQNCSLSQQSLSFISIFKALETLKISNNERNDKYKNYLGTINMDIFETSSSLKNLFLCNVGISFLPRDFGSLKFIEYLDLSRNSLSWLPESFSNLHFLKICKLNNNLISFLPKQFGTLTNLRELDLSNNCLTELPDITNSGDLINLECIDLYNNKLEIIDPGIINLKALKGLDLECNYIDFNVLSYNSVDREEFISKYLVLKQFHRQKLSEKRCDVQLNKINELQSLEIDVVEEELEPENKRNAEHKFSCSEMWDCETWDSEYETFNSNEHDEFDPNVNYKHSFETKNGSARGKYRTEFCPGDNHVPSLLKYFIKNMSRNTNEDIIDGQYDLDD